MRLYTLAGGLREAIEYGARVCEQLGVLDDSMLKELIDFPKGDHRRPPAFLSRAIWGQAFRLFDDLGDLKCLGLVLGGS